MTASNEFLSLRRVLGDLTSLISTQAAVPQPGSAEYWATPQVGDFAPIARALAAPRGARGSILGVSDPSDDAAPRQFAAVQLARWLSAGGDKVLLVDAESEATGFSRGLAEPEAEGFLDLVHYGSSPTATVQPSPIRGVAALSAGSFRPLPGDELERQALTRALAQLRSHFNWIVIAFPALRSGASYHELLAHADAIVLASAASDARAARLGRLADHMHSQKLPLRGAILFTPKAEVPAEPPRRAAPDADASRSSPVFRWAVAVAALALLGFVGWWATAQWRQTPPQLETTASRDETVVPSQSASLPEPSFAEVLPDAAGDSFASDSVAVLRQEPPPATATPPRQQESAPQTASIQTQPERAPLRRAETTSGLESYLSREPVDCWSLHVWSFPDSMEAEVAARGLRGEGLAPRILGVNLPERGRWYRVVVGCFEQRGEALSARGLMASWPGVENVGIVRVP
jgi:hypothetical protein